MDKITLSNIEIIEIGILELGEAVSKFKFFDKDSGVQREIKRKHVEKIKESMIKNYIPINVKVNQDWYILDGQHSFTALKELGILDAKISYTMYYTSCNDHSMCTLLNNNNKSWDANDYLESFVSIGNENYIWFKEFREKYNLNHQTAIVATFNTSVGGDNKFNFIFNSGNMVISVEEKENAIRVGEWLNDIKNLINKKDSKITKARIFQKAFIKIAYDKNYNHNRMLKKVESYTDRIYHCSTEKAYVKMLNDVYNFKDKNKINFQCNN